MFASVVLKNTNRDYDKFYTYRVPEKYEKSIWRGTLVTVPFGFGKRKEKAIVVDLIDDYKADFVIKEIIGVEKNNIYLEDTMLRLMNWMKQRYFCCYYDILKLMLPLQVAARKKTMKTAILNISKEEALRLLSSNTLTQIKHIRVIQTLIEEEMMPVSEICRYLSISTSIIKTLEKRKIVRIEDVKYDRSVENVELDAYIDKRPVLNDSQKLVVDKIVNGLLKYSKHLLYGVTGSGKTEVYMHIIEEVIKKGKSAMVLVPEIALTPQLTMVLRGRFGDTVAIIHSKLSVGERFDSWKRIQEGKVKIVVGARSCIFAPLKNIGIVIIDEEHEYSYKSEITPKYNAKEIAKKIAMVNNAVLLYGSATPLVESYYTASKTENLHVLKNRAAAIHMPKVTLVDMKREASSQYYPLSDVFIDKAKETIRRNEKVMILLNRRGYNHVFICSECGKPIKCKHCSVALKYHKRSNRLICHQCGYTVIPEKCDYCGSENLKGIGFGTQMLEEMIKNIFSEVKIFRLDTDTANTKHGSANILAEFKKEGASILIGTQMIAKGHDIEDVTLVCVVSADMMLASCDFRASERTFSLLTQVVGRAGRGRKQGEALIQSFNIDDYSIKHALAQDYESFYRDEIKMRELMHYPPFCHVGMIELKGEILNKLKENANWLGSLIKNQANIEVIGPYSPMVSYLSNKHRLRFTIKSNRLDLLLKMMTNIDEKCRKKLSKNAIMMLIDIDPYNML